MLFYYWVGCSADGYSAGFAATIAAKVVDATLLWGSAAKRDILEVSWQRFPEKSEDSGSVHQPPFRISSTAKERFRARMKE